MRLPLPRVTGCAEAVSRQAGELDRVITGLITFTENLHTMSYAEDDARLATVNDGKKLMASHDALHHLLHSLVEILSEGSESCGYEVLLSTLSAAGLCATSHFRQRKAHVSSLASRSSSAPLRSSHSCRKEAVSDMHSLSGCTHTSRS